MNKRLAEFLMSLVADAARLSAFNGGDEGREKLLADADLPDEDKAALRSDDSAQVLRRLQATEADGLTWVVAPAIKKFAVGFAIKVVDAPAIKDAAARAVAIKDTQPAALAIKDSQERSALKKPAAGGKKKGGGVAAAPAKRGRAGSSSARGKTRKPRR
ncbi:MAG: hypothetical protein ABI818_06960 [Acidobacteriota bacterium]